MKLHGMILGLLLAVVENVAMAETLYLRAQPSIPLASGPGAEAMVVARLTPGEAVTVIAREGGAVNVETAAGATGWLSEAVLTAELPPTARLAELEQEIAGVRGELATAQSNLRNTQAQLRQAQQAVSAARSSGQGEVAGLEEEITALQAQLASREQELGQHRQRVVQLEMAQEASRLLAASPTVATTTGTQGYSTQTLVSFGAAALLLALGSMWLGAVSSRQRLRRRYHGLEL